jgi:hypothetical protein
MDSKPECTIEATPPLDAGINQRTSPLGSFLTEVPEEANDVAKKTVAIYKNTGLNTLRAI